MLLANFKGREVCIRARLQPCRWALWCWSRRGGLQSDEPYGSICSALRSIAAQVTTASAARCIQGL